MKGFLIRGWHIILSGSGGISTLPRVATLVAGSLCESKTISDQPMGGGVSTPCGVGIDPGEPIFVPGLLGL